MVNNTKFLKYKYYINIKLYKKIYIGNITVG